MKIQSLHKWDVTPAEAITIQRRLAGMVVEKPPDGFKPGLVAAADISSNRFSNTLFAAIAVLALPELEVVEIRTARVEATFPYVPGLLSFRELPALEAAFIALKSEPDVIIMDGQGRAHPRRFGLACHAGLMLGCPTIGVAKSVLVGEYREPAVERSNCADLVHNGEVIGEALRTRTGVKPVFISVGHLVDLPTARRLVLACAPRYRIPVPVRTAHDAANQARRDFYAEAIS